MKRFSGSLLSAASSVSRWRPPSSLCSQKGCRSTQILADKFEDRDRQNKIQLPKKILRPGILLAATAAAAAVGFSSMSTSNGGWWIPSSDGHLEEAETKVLSALKSDVETSFVELDNGHRVRTVVVNKGCHSDKIPLVLVHGFAAAAGTWAKNLDALAADRTVYAMDQVGFGRSDRPEFSADAKEAEGQFVENLEQWRMKMELDSFILLGHSLGGFVSLAYSMKYPGHIRHLILAEPWGFSIIPPEGTRWQRERPYFWRFANFVNTNFNPLGILRAAGPMGFSMFRNTRKDIHGVFSDMYPDNTMMEYMYHCNVQQPSGEIAMKSLMKVVGHAENPMLERIGDLSPAINVSFIYGKRSWNDSKCGVQSQEILGTNRATVDIIEEANHHVYGFDGFNELVKGYCSTVEAS